MDRDAPWLKALDVHVNAIGPAKCGQVCVLRRLTPGARDIKAFDAVVANDFGCSSALPFDAPRYKATFPISYSLMAHWIVFKAKIPRKTA